MQKTESRTSTTEQTNWLKSSDIQNLWDEYRKATKINLIVSGSVYSLMQKIFTYNSKPLFGRVDGILKLSPFKIDVFKQIMKDYAPTST